MAAKRGLNMGRGLESLFSKRPGSSAEAVETSEKAAAAKEKAVAKKKPPAKKPSAAKKKPAATKKPAEKPQSAPAEAGAPENNITSTDNPGGVLLVSIKEVVPNAAQPRKDFDEEAIAELAASIREFGVLQPLLVQKKDDKYEIIAGERRWRAAKKTGLSQIPVLVREYSDRETFEISLIENLQRENLNAIEEAQAYQRLAEEYQLTQEEIAQRVSKSRTAITNALRLLKLENEVQQLLIAGDLTMGHARALLSLPSGEMQVLTARRVATSGISVRDTERMVKKMLKPAVPRDNVRAKEQLDAALKSIEERLRKMTGTKVAIHPGRGGAGRIEIEYYSLEDLERIISLIG